jgi:hypothetical protein
MRLGSSVCTIATSWESMGSNYFATNNYAHVNLVSYARGFTWLNELMTYKRHPLLLSLFKNSLESHIHEGLSWYDIKYFKTQFI